MSVDKCVFIATVIVPHTAQREHLSVLVLRRKSVGELVFLENGGSKIPRSESADAEEISPLVLRENNNKSKPDPIQKQVINVCSLRRLVNGG